MEKNIVTYDSSEYQQWLQHFSPFVQVPLAQLHEMPILQARLAKFTIPADGAFAQVSLALRGMTQPLGVAEYQTNKMIEELKSELPSIDDLEDTLNSADKNHNED